MHETIGEALLGVELHFSGLEIRFKGACVRGCSVVCLTLSRGRAECVARALSLLHAGVVNVPCVPLVLSCVPLVYLCVLLVLSCVPLVAACMPRVLARALTLSL